MHRAGGVLVATAANRSECHNARRVFGPPSVCVQQEGVTMRVSWRVPVSGSLAVLLIACGRSSQASVYTYTSRDFTLYIKLGKIERDFLGQNTRGEARAIVEDLDAPGGVSIRRGYVSGSVSGKALVF